MVPSGDDPGRVPLLVPEVPTALTSVVTWTGFWQRESLRTLAGQVPTVELKVVAHEHGVRSLRIAADRGSARRIYFLDTPDLALYRHGVVVRFRDRRHRRDDAVVKLRPVEPGRLPGWLHGANRFSMEMDALPDRAMCSGTLKKRLGRHQVSRPIGR